MTLTTNWAALRWLRENQNKLNPNQCHYPLITYLSFAYLLLKNPWTVWCIPVPNLIFFIANFLLKTSNLWIWRKRIKATHDCACLLCRCNHSRNLNFHGFEPTKFNIFKLKKIPVPQLHRFTVVNLWCPSCGLVYYPPDW